MSTPPESVFADCNLHVVQSVPKDRPATLIKTDRGTCSSSPVCFGCGFPITALSLWRFCYRARSFEVQGPPVLEVWHRTGSGLRELAQSFAKRGARLSHMPCLWFVSVSSPVPAARHHMHRHNQTSDPKFLGMVCGAMLAICRMCNDCITTRHHPRPLRLTSYAMLKRSRPTCA